MKRRAFYRIRHTRKSNKPAISNESSFENVTDRFWGVFDKMYEELQRRNLTFPALLENYDYLISEKALLQKDKDFFFHQMQEWKSMYKEIFRWQKYVYEAIPVLPPESQKNFLGRIKELEKIDQEIADKRMKEMFGSE